MELPKLCAGNEVFCTVDLSGMPSYLADKPRPYELNYLYFRSFGQLGVLANASDPEAALTFAHQYGCRSKSHALANLVPYEICSMDGPHP